MILQNAEFNFMLHKIDILTAFVMIQPSKGYILGSVTNIVNILNIYEEINLILRKDKGQLQKRSKYSRGSKYISRKYSNEEILFFCNLHNH